MTVKEFREYLAVWPDEMILTIGDSEDLDSVVKAIYHGNWDTTVWDESINRQELKAGEWGRIY